MTDVTLSRRAHMDCYTSPMECWVDPSNPEGCPMSPKHVLNSGKVGDEVVTQGHCPYCQKNTNWLLQVVEPGVIRFACLRCKKIERDVSLQ